MHVGDQIKSENTSQSNGVFGYGFMLQVDTLQVDVAILLVVFELCIKSTTFKKLCPLQDILYLFAMRVMDN